MSELITDKLVTPCGKLTNQTLGGYVDVAGNIVGSAGFLNNFIVDYAGNLGSLEVVVYDCTVIASIIGSAFPPGNWEMQASTVETIGLNGGIISNNFIAGASSPNILHAFVSKNATGYLDGVVSGTGTFTIKAGPEAIGGTGYVGAGLLVMRGANTHTGPITMEVGTRLQFGNDCSNIVTRALGGLTIGEGAVATQYTSYNVNTFVTQALNNNGTYNVIGCGDCGKGIGLSTTVGNNGTINIDKALWRNGSTWSGTGVVNVKAGATFQLGAVTIGATTTVNLNGCGWKNASCVEQGALNCGSNMSYAFRLNIQSESCLKILSNSMQLTGVMTGSAPLNISSFNSPKPAGSVAFTNTANTYFGTINVDGVTLDQQNGNSLQFAKINLKNSGRISSPNSQTIGSLSGDATSSWQIGGSNNVFIKNNGITQFDGNLQMTGSIANVWLEGGAGNQLTLTKTGQTATVYARNGSKVILQGATFLLGGSGGSGQMRISAGSTISAGTSTTAACTFLYIDSTSALDVRSITPTSTGLLRVTSGFSMGAGWKINALDPLLPGTYPIIQKPNTTLLTPAPTLGINNTGYNVTFTQVGNFVNMVVS
jgi:hypothetical protein